jgi:hypothetical protein
LLPSVHERLGLLPPELQPLAEAVRRHYPRGASVRPDGTVQVAPMPWVGPEAFAFVLYAPAKPAWIAAFAHRLGRPIPEAYGVVLAALNGCFAFGMALYGLPPSLQEPASRLDPHTLQPLDLEAANRHWVNEYRDAQAEFHFGGCTWTATENVGYFITPGGTFRTRRKDGEVLREWPSIGALLADELPFAEARDRERRPLPWTSARGDP